MTIIYQHFPSSILTCPHHYHLWSLAIPSFTLAISSLTIAGPHSLSVALIYYPLRMFAFTIRLSPHSLASPHLLSSFVLNLFKLLNCCELTLKIPIEKGNKLFCKLSSSTITFTLIHFDWRHVLSLALINYHYTLAWCLSQSLELINRLLPFVPTLPYH